MTSHATKVNAMDGPPELELPRFLQEESKGDISSTCLRNFRFVVFRPHHWIFQLVYCFQLLRPLST